MDVVEIYPAAHDVVVANVPAGTILRIHHPAGARDYTAPDGDGPLIAAIPGDREHLGWGTYIKRYSGAHALRNGHHSLDRPLWHQAHRHVRDGGVAVIQHARHDHYGRPRWTAVHVRREALVSSLRPGAHR